MTRPAARDVAELLAQIGALRFGRFRLKDGRESPFYIDLRGIIAFPRVLRKVGEWLSAVATPLHYDCIAAIPYAGIPLGVAMALAADKPLVYARKEAKDYGTERRVEGHFRRGDRALVVDDVLTSGAAKVEALAPLRDVGLVVTDVLVIVDREEGGAELLRHSGITSHRLITVREVLREFRNLGLVTSSDYDSALRFLTKT
ncbi:Orotate phosphoribosyltransferase [bacterium HR30]|jgi:uridine monophosphate synthetase|nr:Orotate phosphoribosyltransferase [bacterium HR30]